MLATARPSCFYLAMSVCGITQLIWYHYNTRYHGQPSQQPFTKGSFTPYGTASSATRRRFHTEHGTVRHRSVRPDAVWTNLGAPVSVRMSATLRCRSNLWRAERVAADRPDRAVIKRLDNCDVDVRDLAASHSRHARWMST